MSDNTRITTTSALLAAIGATVGQHADKWLKIEGLESVDSLIVMTAFVVLSHFGLASKLTGGDGTPVIGSMGNGK